MIVSIVLKCRKNYCNLLLLSVMLFALGTSVRPVLQTAYAECSWSEQRTEGDLQWKNQSGAIVYQGQQLTATAGNEFVGINTNVCEMLTGVNISSYEICCNEDAPRHNEYSFSVSRAPPAA
jgi:hypothetical protein